MKFTRTLRLAALLNICLLVGCSSFSSNQDVEQMATSAAQQNLSPTETKVLAVKAEPNLYKTQVLQRPAAQDVREFKQALGLKKQGKLSEAAVILKRLSERQPKLSGVWLQLALINKAQNQDASDYLNNAISVNPHNYLAHNELALLLRQQGKFRQALSHYNAALKSWPAFAEAYLNRGILYDLYLGKKSQALADYQIYQGLQAQESRQMKGWIMDIQRQIKSAQSRDQEGAAL